MTRHDPIFFPHLKTPPRLLLGPGPSQVDPRVLQIMGTPLLGHLDPSFLEIMDSTQDLLRYVFETENQFTIPISGTGTAAMETAVANMVEPGDSVLVCINGYFGMRIADMATRYGAAVRTLSRPWGEVFSADEIAQAMETQPAKIVAIVQAETSTGVLQPLGEIARVVHQRNGLLLADAVTSLGGVQVSVDETGIDICYSGSQKCLGCPPGIGPITLGTRAVNVLKTRQTQVPIFYLDLTLLSKYWGAERSYHHTAPITSNYAIYEGLRIVAEEGLQNRWQRHRKNAELLWKGLEELGLKLQVPVDYRLPTLTTVRIPEGVSDAQIRSKLLSDYNIEIGGGLGELKGKVWRIGLMGYSSRPENVLLLLAALERLLK